MLGDPRYMSIYLRTNNTNSWLTEMSNNYRSGTVNSKSFVCKVLLRIKWRFELTVQFKQEMIEKHFIKISQKL